MKFIKHLTETENVRQSRTKVYEDVSFVNGFGPFLYALELDQLLEGGRPTKETAGDWCWGDNRAAAGIKLNTNEHPLVKRTSKFTITVSGRRDALDMFETVLNRYAHFGDLTEKAADDVELSHKYHSELNPAFWEDKTMKPDVRKKLLNSANAFFDTLKTPRLEVEDIILTGSNANYNWTNQSDLDVHLVVDFDQAKKDYGSIVEEYFDAKKKVWNDTHNIQMLGHDVEMYVQDAEEKHTASGMYSLLNDQWIVEPTHNEPSIDSKAVKAKAAEIITQIDNVVGSCNKADAVEKLMDKIKKMRQAGLSSEGEFSTENLVFKILRNQGYLEKMAQCKTRAFDRALSVEEEEWSHLK